MNIRNSAKAVILNDQKLLAIKKEDSEGYYYLLPGGGQEHGESLHQAVERECIEEIGEKVVVKDLLFIREYIGRNHEHASFDGEVHQIEYMFLCDLVEEQSAFQNGIQPDEGQIGVEWIPLTVLLNHRLYPQSMRQKLIDYVDDKKVPVYLGDVN